MKLRVPEFLSIEQIDCCRRIGRDEEARSTTIALVELDALCDTALRAHVYVNTAAGIVLNWRRQTIALHEGRATDSPIEELLSRTEAVTLQRAYSKIVDLFELRRLCKPEPFSSRTCEFGTDTCTVVHDKSLP